MAIPMDNPYCDFAPEVIRAIMVEVQSVLLRGLGFYRRASGCLPESKRCRAGGAGMGLRHLFRSAARPAAALRGAVHAANIDRPPTVWP